MDGTGDGTLVHIPQGKLAKVGRQLWFSRRAQKVLEFDWPQMKVLDASHRHGKSCVGEDELHQGTRRHHMQLRHFLVEVAQRRQGLGSGLDLVQEQEALFGSDGFSRQQGQGGEDSGRVAKGEGFAKLRVALEVELHQRKTRRSREFAHQRGLADLSGTANDDRLVRVPRRPLVQIADFGTFQKFRHRLAIVSRTQNALEFIIHYDI